MKKLIILFILCLAWAGSAGGANCGGVTPCACGDTITSDYTFAANLNCTNAGVALTTATNDIIIDLNGYTLDGDDTNTTIGIRVTGGTNIAVRNGTITDFTTSGLSVEGNSTGIVDNLICNSMGNQGFQNLATASWTYNNIIGNDNVDDGFSMHDDTIATINTGIFNGNAEGINMIHDTVLTANNITVLNNTSKSLWITDSEGTSTTGPTITVNGLEANTWAATDIKGAIYGTRMYFHDVPTNHHIATKISATGGRALTVTQSIFKNIVANKFAIAIQSGTPIISNILIMDDIKTGKGIYSDQNLTIYNSIFTNLVTGIHQAGGTVNHVTSGFYQNTNDTVGTVSGTKLFTTNPLLDPSTHRPLPGSPAINAGDPNTCTTLVNSTDFAGKTVCASSTAVGDWKNGVEIGAYGFFNNMIPSLLRMFYPYRNIIADSGVGVGGEFALLDDSGNSLIDDSGNDLIHD